VIVISKEAVVAAVRDSIRTLRENDDPSPLDEGAIEYDILKLGLEETDLEPICPRPFDLDPTELLVLET